jgi:TPR repeat protein
LGQSYLLGRGAEKNPTVASLYYRKACGGGDASSCYGLAMLYLRGTGVRQSEDLAEQSMQRACALGMRMACMLADPNMAQINPNLPPVSPGAPTMAQPAGR